MDLRAGEYEQILRLQLEANETKNKKIGLCAITMTNFFTYICCLNFFAMLLTDNFIFEEKKLPAVTTYFFSHESLFWWPTGIRFA